MLERQQRCSFETCPLIKVSWVDGVGRSDVAAFAAYMYVVGANG